MNRTVLRTVEILEIISKHGEISLADLVLIVFAPILVPAMEAYGIDTLYFGIVLVLTVLVGSITPPVGSLLYLGSSIAKTTVSKAGKEVWIFVAMIMSVIGLLVIFPQIVLFLPDLLYN